ncbi:MAG: regulatory protein RecX [Dehalococcoidia bacterium]
MDEPPSPTIIEIRSVSHGRQRLLSLSDGREFLFSDEACERCGIGEGQEATSELLSELDRLEQRVNAHEAALRLLSSRPRSENEMRTRLAMRGVEPSAIDDEVERLHSSGLLDDQKFAEAWVEDRKRASPRGKRMLRYELLGRGIDPAAAEQATSDVDDRETAMSLARARSRRAPVTSYEAFFAKVGGFLRRRGFDYEVTADATRQAWAEVLAARQQESDLAATAETGE